MKPIVRGTLVTLLVAGAAGYAFRAPLLEVVADRLTADMFVAADADSFDPGVATGAPLPGLRALHDGREVHGVDTFAGSRGTVLFVSRSVDW